MRVALNGSNELFVHRVSKLTSDNELDRPFRDRWCWILFLELAMNIHVLSRRKKRETIE